MSVHVCLHCEMVQSLIDEARSPHSWEIAKQLLTDRWWWWWWLVRVRARVLLCLWLWTIITDLFISTVHCPLSFTHLSSQLLQQWDCFYVFTSCLISKLWMFDLLQISTLCDQRISDHVSNKRQRCEQRNLGGTQQNDAGASGHQRLWGLC